MFLKNEFFVVFDDVEYAELAFRDARDLVIYYRRLSQRTNETLRDNYKRKKKDNQRPKRIKLNHH